MITQETAAHIYHAFREVESGEKLLLDMKEAVSWPNELNKTEPRLKDAFGRRQHLQMGVPSGKDCHRLLEVSPQLAESVIRAHIANKKRELAELQETARIELNEGITGS